MIENMLALKSFLFGFFLNFKEVALYTSN